MQQPDLLYLFVYPLEQAGLDYMITGAVASTFYGEPRLTHDIDLVIVLKSSEADSFVSLFPAYDYYCPPQEVLRIEIARKQNAHFNLIHHESGYKADCYVAGSHPLHSWGLAHRRRLKISSILDIWVAPPEYVIIRKLQFFKEGGSQKHLVDIQKICHTEDAGISWETLRLFLDKYNLEKEWKLCTESES